jgi:hypothetical protein
MVFLDDILIYSGSESEHLQHIQLVFELLKKHKFYLKETKCTFAKDKLDYLGHIISA